MWDHLVGFLYNKQRISFYLSLSRYDRAGRGKPGPIKVPSMLLSAL